MAVELWNDRTRNAIAEFDSEAEALAFVHETIKRYGTESVAGWAMDRAEDQPMLRGAELVKRALAVPV